MNLKTKYDVIVIGGGHAGYEAACAAARLGCQTALITISPENIGELSCNPAIGGIGKGTLVREVDALGGLMGQIADRAGIHFKMLNASKGSAVWGPRAQMDRALYKTATREILSNYPNLSLLYGKVASLLLTNNVIEGVTLESGESIKSTQLVLTTGTFLSGVIHIGDKKIAAGRVGEPPSNSLSKSLALLNLKMGRLKTGTPPRIDRDSINYEKTELQPGDNTPTPFSISTESITTRQIPCHITRTTAETHEVIRDNIQLSAMYSGNITGTGPRYCPSIEDKITRFADKNSHQIFLEPEGLDSNIVYPNGISTSLPEFVQDQMISSIIGLEKAKITQHGYAIEYDYVEPTELDHSLKVKKCNGLYLAGQINGTTGYEEAAGQGIIAGINAALAAQNKKAFTLSRSEAYIGVMIDDLVTLGTKEPYRMFTSRAEYRLSLRADNADQRLCPRALEIGLLSAKRAKSYTSKTALIAKAKELLDKLTISSHKLNIHGAKVSADGKVRSAYELMSLKQISLEKLIEIFPTLADFDHSILNILFHQSRYEPYLQRQQDDIKLLKQEELTVIPYTLDYNDIYSLSNEAKEKLNLAKPNNIHAAGKIAGITPAALTAIIIHLRNNEL